MSGTSFTIRKAKAADCDRIHALLKAMSEELGDAGYFASTPAILRRFGFGEKPLFDTVVADEEGEVVGLALYFPDFSTLRGIPGTYLQDLYVARTHRSRALGEKLVRAVSLEAARWHGCYIKLSVHNHNNRARSFYNRLGFLPLTGETTMILTGTNK